MGALTGSHYPLANGVAPESTTARKSVIGAWNRGWRGRHNSGPRVLRGRGVSMTDLLHELILRSAAASPAATAVTFTSTHRSYAQLAADIDSVARGLLALDTGRLDRVAIYLPKTLECVAAIFGI